jgi:ADP-ribose pyrophosphatase
MAPLPAPEPARHLETTASLDARKLRFEVNRVQLPMGVQGSFGVIKHPGASLAVPVLDDGRVVVLREFPAGTLDPGETPLSTMQRELQEEAGYSASCWDALGAMLPCPGYSDEVIHLFLARDLTELRERPAGDDDEDLEVVLMTPAELDAAIASGNEYLDGKSITAWFRAKQLLGLA